MSKTDTYPKKVLRVDILVSSVVFELSARILVLFILRVDISKTSIYRVIYKENT